MPSLADVFVLVIDEVTHSEDFEAKQAATKHKRLYALCWESSLDLRLFQGPRPIPVTVCFGVPPGHPNREIAPFYALFQHLGQRWNVEIIDRRSGLAALRRLGIAVSSGVEKMCRA